MQSNKRKIFIIGLTCALIIAVASAEITEQAPTEKQPSTWDLIRKSQMKQTQSAEPAISNRVLHFPKERSLGRLMIGKENPDDSSIPFEYPADGIYWEHYSRAQGDVRIPNGKKFGLILDPRTWRNPQSLSALKQLQPDDLYMLSINIQNSDGSLRSDRCMPHIAHLTGLKALTLINTNTSGKGLKYLSNLSSLERLNTRIKLTEEGLAEIVRLSSLKALSIRDNSLINNDLAQLAKLPLLEELELVGKGGINDAGLAHLAKLPNLRYLALEGLVFTDAGMAHLKNCSSLLALDLGTQKLPTDRTLVHLSEIPQLERLDLHWNENITDAGIIHLTKLKSLTLLDIKHAKVTNEGLAHLANIQTLENLTLPDTGVTDAGIEHIAQLQNLRYLWAGSRSSSPLTDKSLQYISALKNLKELHIGGTGFGDVGMKNIAKLKKLRHLSIFTANQLTNDGLAELGTLEILTNLSLGRNTKASISGLKFLNRLKNLKSLSIREIHQDGSVMDISGLTNLQSLTLLLHNQLKDGIRVYDSFKDEDWACLTNLTELKRLQITGVGINNDGIKHLSGMRNIEFMNIICPAEEKITDEALKYMVGMHKLNRLYIKDGHFTDKALDYLDGLPLLTWLELTSDYAFSNRAIRDFQRKNPNVTKLQLIP